MENKNNVVEMKDVKKISVIGAGAIGTLVGGLIKQHLPEVELVLITRGDHCRRMQETGQAILEGFWGQHSVPVQACSDAAAAANSDLILFTVKSQSTEATARQIEPLLDDAIVVSLQNGINQSTLLKFVRPERLLVGMTATNMALVEPGRVSLQRNGISVIGSPTGDVPATVVDKVRELLACSGLTFAASDDILGVQYNKLLMNTMGYASVVSASEFIRDGILSRRWRNHVALPLLQEGLSVLEAAGIQLQRTSGMSDVLRFQRLLHALNFPLLDRTIHWFLATIVRPKPIVYSVYQDLQRNKPTEIDYVNGEIVRLAENCGRKAPYNRLVVRLIHQLESQDSKQFLTSQEVIERFAELSP